MDAQGNGDGAAQYALLIGIDFYIQKPLADGAFYPHLRGCVRDVNLVEAFLKRKLQLRDDAIIKLTATDTGRGQPAEEAGRLPNYENLIGAFRRLGEIAQAGDQVYIHYSGHGARVPTLFPERKGTDATDESLVPYNISDPNARYLRDVEIAYLLHDLVEKGLVVTVVFDSCHSGGTTRGGSVRGVDFVDRTDRPGGSLVAPVEDLATRWDVLAGEGSRDVQVASGWLPEPEGYVLLAACRANELAYEDIFEGNEKNGALTYWLLNSLENLGPGLTYKMLHDRILAKVHSRFVEQTPQLQGDGSREVFGTGRVKPFYAVPVIGVNPAREEVTLNAGQAHGLRAGAHFAIYPGGVVDPSDTRNRLALVEITNPGAVTSTATIRERYRDNPLEQGSQAILLGAGSLRLVRQIRLLPGGEAPDTIDEEAALEALGAAISENPWLERVTGEAGFDMQVAINADGEYEVRDGAGVAIKNLRPPIKVGTPDAPERVGKRLEHLAKYRAVHELDPNDPLSALARRLKLEILDLGEYELGDPLEGEPLGGAGNTPLLAPGQWVAVRIRNETTKALNVTVFNLTPSWAAKQVYPSGEGDYFITLDAGQEVRLPLKAGLPEEYQEGTDILKVFGTLGTTNFRWLELPPLDEPLVNAQQSQGRAPLNPLEQLLSAFTAGSPPTRDLIPASHPSQEWTVAQVELRVRR